MSVNKYRDHLRVIPEDDANRQIVVGFMTHPSVSETVVGIESPAGGWPNVLESFSEVFVSYARNYPKSHIALLIDFDQVMGRRAYFEERIPDDVKHRVFVIGSWNEAEDLKRELGMTLEAIGEKLAQECAEGQLRLWNHTLLDHNREELNRMITTIKRFLFQAD
jgi:hypothetical protein